jgi:nucleoside 2-deoxyribosyltransferase
MRLLLPDDLQGRIPDDDVVIFLAGSIDEGRAERWQDEAVDFLSARDVTILNPRRSTWDADLRQDIDEPEFERQVDWELDGIERADVVLFHFSPAGPAPITLLELGKATALDKRVVVSCPPGYWRRGNVQVVCRRSGVTVHDSLEIALAELGTILDTIPTMRGRHP